MSPPIYRKWQILPLFWQEIILQLMGTISYLILPCILGRRTGDLVQEITRRKQKTRLLPFPQDQRGSQSHQDST